MSGNNNEDDQPSFNIEPRNVETGDSEVPEFRQVVDHLTVAALREYDDGPLTPPRQSVQESNPNENGGGENELGDENNLVVLDPDHPLMVRFQRALKHQLERRDERLTLEVRETKYQLDKAKREREELGVELYGLQQELAKNQKLLEEKFDDYNDVNQGRKIVEEELDEIRKDYRDQQQKYDDEMRKLRDLQSERDNLKLRIHHMSMHKDMIRGDIAVLRRATEKAETEKNKFEIEKQRQDMLVNRLQEQEMKVKEDISLYEWQLSNQMKETKVAEEALKEARMESEAIEKEKNQLMLNWTNCLNGMKRRDEAFSQMNDAIRSQRQKYDSTATEIDSYKKSIIKEQERNESLTLITNQRHSEIKNLEKSLQINKDKMDLLQQEYSQFNRALKETENKLTAINLEIGQKKSVLTQHQREIENLSQERVRIEDEIFKKLQEKLTADKAAEYSDKLRKAQKEKLAEIEKRLAETENDIARAKLEGLQKQSLNEALERECVSLRREIDDRNRIVSKSESEIRQRVLLIEAKQGQVDLYNKKIDQLIEKAGGVELGPLELEEKNLNKEIDDLMTRIMELEQKWLREQNELVSIVKNREIGANDISKLNDRLIVLTTKKMRTEKTIEEEQANIKNIHRSLNHIRLDIEKLNKFIDAESKKKENLINDLRTTTNAFQKSLKAAENVTIDIQAKIHKNREDREELANVLIETDKEIMDWERRIRLAKEMKSAVDSEVGQGEIKEMKFEIHRMKARLTYFYKEQEKLIRDMESSVLRRDTILTRGELVQKNPNAQTQGKIQKEMSHIQRKIKETTQEINRIDSEMRLLKDKQQQLANVLDDKQKNLQGLQEEVESKNSLLDELSRKKQEKIEERIAQQNRLKYYDRVKQGKYKMMCGGQEAQLEQELTRQLDRLRALGAIVSKLGDEYPDMQINMRRVETSIQSRLNQEEEAAAASAHIEKI